MVDISESLKNVFSKWDARLFILVSLLFQVILILFAPRRQRSTSKSLTFFIWSSYLLADWAAGYTLGLLCQSQVGSDCDATTSKGNVLHADDHQIITTSKHKLSHGYNDNLLAFWAPFLLLHLGGPDSITAFSMEDNSLWLRRLVGLLFQVVIAVYVVLLSLPDNRLLIPTILMFLAGTIKCSERMVALYFASSNAIVPVIHYLDTREIWNQGSKYWNYNMVLFAYDLVAQYKVVIVGRSVYDTHTYFDSFGEILEGERAFKLIEWELGLMYDSFFTKATVVHTCIGYALHVLCSSLILAASVLFFLSSKNDFMRIDVSITYVLLAGAISLDILGYFMLIFSKWTIVRLKGFEYRFKLSRALIENITPIIYKVVSTSNNWSGLMMQYNLINDCLHQISHFDDSKLEPTLIESVTRKLKDFIVNSFLHYIFHFDCKLESTWSEPVTCDLKGFIFEYVKKRFDDSKDMRLSGNLQKMLQSRGHLPLENMDQEFQRSIECRFESSILIWHVATDLCYYTEDKRATTDQKHQDLSKLISNYIVYLLFMRPSMIPSVSLEFGHDAYENAHDDILKELKIEQNQEFKEACNIHQEACNILLDYIRVDDGPKPFEVFAEAVALAKKTKELDDGGRWRKVAEVWADMLLYVANDCPGTELAQSLGRGGELLTSVSFLLYHYCLGRGGSNLPVLNRVPN